MDYIPFSDIITEFNFSSAKQFNRFCKDNLHDIPSNLRNKYAIESKKTLFCSNLIIKGLNLIIFDKMRERIN